MKQKELILKLKKIKQRNEVKTEIRKELSVLKQEIDSHFSESLKLIEEGLSDDKAS